MLIYKIKSNYKRLYISILLIIIPLFLSSCFKMRMRDKAIYEEFSNTAYKPKIVRYTIEEREIYYVEVGADTLPMVLFIHGAPGSWIAFKEFMKDSTLLRKARMISVDRPGHGYSGLGKAEISIKKQAALLKPILDLNKNPKAPILVGHSYGGPIIAQMAMDYPELVGPLVMAAPAIDPKNEKVFWVSYPADWFLFRWALPRSIRVTNDEKLSHVEELNKMLPYWQQLHNPTTLIHGEKDGLVPIENSYFGEKMMLNAPLEVIYDPKLNHLIPWKRPDLIKNAILKYLWE
ncbi:MAG: alpha/beta hydrolase [Microscillaceae bacterium]|nr:alpha/beta hydrolase [Microscillaceae bacterium]